MADDQTPSPIRLHDIGRNQRRSLADALEVLRNQPGFSESTQAVIRTAPIALPTDESGSLVQFQCRELAIAISLCTSIAFFGRQTLGDEVEFDIVQLNGASVDANGNVELIDGTYLHAVRLSPVRHMRAMTDQHWLIIHAAIAFAGAADRCYRHVDKERLPDWKHIDFVSLRGIKVSGLKDFHAY